MTSVDKIQPSSGKQIDSNRAKVHFHATYSCASVVISEYLIALKLAF